MCESPISRDTLLIIDKESRVKQRVLKILLKCFMRQLQNEIIASPDDVDLLAASHDVTNNLIISDTMLCSLSPPQLRTMADNHKTICGCAICNTSKYSQKLLNAWQRKKLKS